MKVIELELYRLTREIRKLEERMSQLVLSPEAGAASAMKVCFREWLKKTKVDAG